jgi:hypothetical protein
MKKLNILNSNYNKNNCEESNLTSLCNDCNVKVYFNGDFWVEFFNNKYKNNIVEG